MSDWTIGRRLGVGFLALLLVSSAGVAAAVYMARQATVALEEVAREAERGRRLSRVGAMVREFYMHQAHLALGLHAEHHRGMARKARIDLGAALGALDPADSARTADDVAELDRLFEGEFLPALDAERMEQAIRVHHRAVERVDRLVTALEAEQVVAGRRIHNARTAAERAAERAQVYSALLLGLAGVLAMLIATGMTRSITAPVRRLRQAAAGLVAGESEAVPVAGPAEVRALGEALNEMLRALEVQRRGRSAAESMAMLGRVSAGIAHEINNPLAVILGHARMIERVGGGFADDAAAIVQEARQCQAIVQALLDYARPGALVHEPLELRALLEPICERYEATLAMPDAVELEVDGLRIGQLFDNLLRNANAFGEAVTVTVGIEGDNVVAMVEDDGPGVSEADLERIFEPFRSERADGVGLGLPIARSIAESHGGTVRALAGPGGRFVVHLPTQPKDA